MAIKNVRQAEQNIKQTVAAQDASSPSLFHEHPTLPLRLQDKLM